MTNKQIAFASLVFNSITAVLTAGLFIIAILGM